MENKVIHSSRNQRFELSAENSEPAYVSYILAGKTATFDHTYVPTEMRGKGIATILVKAALEEARAQQWKIIPACSYIGTYIKRHPEFSDLLAL